MMSKERPILFSPEMVKAILDGRKTQTRRALKPQPHECHNGDLIYKDRLVGSNLSWRAWNKPNAYGNPMIYEEAYTVCPYGQPGDRLWVRERWAVSLDYDKLAPKEIPSQNDVSIWYQTPGLYMSNRYLGDYPGKTRSSIHMPRWASRITLEITAVRVERLQDISEADIEAEGTPRNIGYTPDDAYADQFNSSFERRGRDFARLWDNINGNGAGSWHANPWVWVIEFKRINDK